MGQGCPLLSVLLLSTLWGTHREQHDDRHQPTVRIHFQPVNWYLHSTDFDDSAHRYFRNRCLNLEKNPQIVLTNIVDYGTMYFSAHTKENTMKLLETMNTIFDSSEHKEQRKMSALMETAGAWCGGETSALYSLLFTEKIHSEDHREECENEIGQEINGLLHSSQEDFATSEIKSLRALKAFVKNFKIPHEKSQEWYNKLDDDEYDQSIIDDIE